MVEYQNARAVRPQPRPRDPMWVTRKWGRQDITPASHLVTGEVTGRLILFRPGTAGADRFWAHAFGYLAYRDGWILIVAACLVGAVTSLPLPGEQLVIAAPAFAAVVTVALVATPWVLGHRALNDARGIKITVRVNYKRGSDPQLEHDSAVATEFCRRLCALDAERLDPVLYEARWSEIYEELALIGAAIEADPAGGQDHG